MVASPKTSATGDGRVEEARQAVGHRKRARLRHGRARVEENELHQHIGERDAEKGHHQCRDDLVDALIGAQQRRYERPDHGDRRRNQEGHEQREPARQCLDQQRCAGGRRDRAEQELAVAAEIPHAGAERDNEAGRDKQQRRHACQRLLDAERRQQSAFQHEAVIGKRIDSNASNTRRQAPAPQGSVRAPSARRCRYRGTSLAPAWRRARRRGGSGILAHAATPTIMRPTRSAAIVLVATVPTRRPLAITAMRSHMLSSSSRSVEISRIARPRAGDVADALARRQRVGEVESVGRLVEDHRSGAPASSRAISTFWMLPPDSRPTGVVHARRADIIFVAPVRRLGGRSRRAALCRERQNGASPTCLRKKLIETGKAPTVLRPAGRRSGSAARPRGVGRRSSASIA